MQYKLSEFKDAWKGRSVTIVGSGPTNHDFDWSKVEGPVFFMNDSISSIERVTEDHYFHSHHPEIERFQNNGLNSLWVVEREYQGTVKKYNYKCPENYIPVRIVQDRRWPKAGAVVKGPMPEWSFDKDYIAESTTLLSHCGSITTILHFLWFAGVKKFIGIGIDPQYGKNHDRRISDKECPDLSSIKINIQKYTEAFGLECQFYELTAGARIESSN